MKRIKKALLFIPPAFSFKDYLDVNPLPPLGLGYLGAVLENHGIEVKIVDCLIEGWKNRAEIKNDIIRIGLPFEQIKEIIRKDKPDLIGINSLFTAQRENAHNIYKIAKEIDRNIVTIAGGAHPTVMPELVLSDPDVDYVVIGEGEETIIDLVDCLEGKRDISTLDGIGYKEEGKVKIIQKTKFIEDLDKLPFPARHLLNMENYFGLEASHGQRRKSRFSPIVTSRGCPAGCTFCSAHRVWGRRFRPRSAENVIAEMKHIKEKYGIEEIMFEDDNTTLDVQRAEKLFDLMIKEKLNFVWDTPNGIAAWTLSEKLLDKMKESGCYKINLALESGSQYVLNNIIKKPLNLEKVKPLAKYAQKIGLEVSIFLIMGLPGETEEQMKESFKLAAELGIWHPFVSVATPYPGSELYDMCLEKGYLNKNFSLDDLFIRSFSISTEDWDGSDLKRIFKEGRKFLIFSYFKRQPITFFIEYIQRFFVNPIPFIKRLYIFIKGGGAERGKEDF